MKWVAAARSMAGIVSARGSADEAHRKTAGCRCARRRNGCAELDPAAVHPRLAGRAGRCVQRLRQALAPGLALSLLVGFAAGAAAQSDPDCSGRPDDGAHTGYLVGHDWPLRPGGLGTGDHFRLIYITTQLGDATSSDIRHYDALVQKDIKARSSKVPDSCADKFQVVGATRVETAPAIGNDFPQDIPIFNLSDGRKVAENTSQFMLGEWARGLIKRADGSEAATSIWTGLEPNTGKGKAGHVLGSEYVSRGILGDIVNFAEISRLGTRTVAPIPVHSRTAHNAFYGISGVFTVEPPPCPDEEREVGGAKAQGAGVGRLADGEILVEVSPPTCKRDLEGYEFRIAPFDDYPAGFAQARPLWGALQCVEAAAELGDGNVCKHDLASLAYDEYRLEVRAKYAATRGPAAEPDYVNVDDDEVATGVRPKTSAPAVPQSPAATAGDAEVLLAWAPPTDDGGAPVVRYDYYLDASGTNNCNDVMADSEGWRDARVNLRPLVPELGVLVTSLPDGRDLANGTKYRFCVRAVNAAAEHNEAEVGAAAFVEGTPLAVPLAPSSIQAEVGDSTVRLTWACVQAINYDYRWTPGEEGFNWRRGSTCQEGQIVQVVPGLVNGAEYEFEVRAVNQSGAGNSITVKATPGPAPGVPSNLEAVQSAGTVTLSWAAPADGGRAIVRYDCHYRCELPMEPGSLCPATTGADIDVWARCPVQPGLTTSAVIPNLSLGQRYAFAVRACNLDATTCPETDGPIGDGASDWNAVEVVIGAVPSAPVLTADVGDRVVTVEWDEAESAGGAVLHYEYRFGSDAAQLGTWAIVPPGTDAARSLTQSGLANDTAYTFAVRAVNALGAGEQAIVTATPVAGVARVTLTATGREREVVLSWVPATDPGAIVGYEYRWGRSAASLGAWQSVALATTVAVSDLEIGVDYVFEVRARTNTGAGNVSRASARALEPAASGLPGRPTRLTVVAARDGQVTLSWQPPPPGVFPVSGYEYRWGRSEEDDGTTQYGAWVNLDAAVGITISVPASGVAYAFEVRAVNQNGAGAAAVVSATPSAGAFAPTALVAVAGDGEVRLTWQAPAAAGGSPLLTYAYRYSAEGTRFGAWTQTGTEPGAVVTGLVNGIVYRFEVRAETESGSSPAVVASATPAQAPTVPHVPRGFAAETLPNGAVTLAWRAPSSDGGLPIVRYELRWRAGDGEFGAWSAAGGTATSRSLDTLTLGQPHTFEVRAVNANGEGEVATVTATPASLPGVPGRLAAATAEGAVALSWIAPDDDGGSAVVRYEYRIAAGTAAFGPWRDAGIAHEATVASLDNGVPHAFEVRAVNGLGAGNAATVTATPAAPPGMVAVGVSRGDGNVSLRWLPPDDDGGSPVLRYEHRHRSPGGEFVPWSVAGLDLEASVGGLTNGVEYTFEVRAVNATGAGAAATVRATPRASTVPDAPALVVVADVRRVELTWETPEDDGGSPIRRYEYRWQPAGDAFGQWLSAGLDAGATVDGLINGVEYMFEVRAANDLGAGEAASASATPADVPSAPTLALRAGSGEVDLSWQVPADDGGVAVLRYEYRWGKADAAAGAWTDAGLDLAATVRDLTDGREYAFAVRAVNARGAGPEAAATATPTPGVADDTLLVAWLGRFGRIAGSHVVGALDDRMRLSDATAMPDADGDVRGDRSPTRTRPASRRAAPRAGDREGGRVRHQGGVGGRLATTTRGWAAGFPALAMTWAGSPGGLLPDGVMSLSAAGAAGGRWTGWGRFEATRFEGEQPGLGLDGRVMTATGGADYLQGSLLAGVALSHSVGRGDFGYLASAEYPARAGDEVESALTGAYPYVRFRRGLLAGWAMLGRGAGSVTVSGAAGERSFDLGSTLGAFGARGTLASLAGLEFAVKSDAFLARVETETEGDAPSATANANRFRLLVETSRAMRTDAGVVTAVGELGFRHDGGSAEKGEGMEFGAGFDYAGGRVDIAGRARTLVLHGDDALREWGGMVSVAVKARPSGRGLSLRLSPGWGVAASGAERLWANGASTRGGVAWGVDEASPHLAAELSFAADAFRGRAVATPFVGFDARRGGQRWRVGWRMSGRGGEFEVEVRRRAAVGVARNAVIVTLTLDPWGAS